MERALVDRSLGLDIARPDHLAPLLSFVGDKLAEIAGRAGNLRATQVRQPHLDHGVGESSVDFLVELVDDRGGRALRRAQPEPLARLEARQKLAHGRYVRQYIRARS